MRVGLHGADDPEQQVAIEIALRDAKPERTWLLLGARDRAAELCQEDPLIGDERYVYVEAGVDDLLPIAPGRWFAAPSESMTPIGA